MVGANTDERSEMKITARTLAPIHCASKDPLRYNINVVHFAKDGTTSATNGHVLARVAPDEVTEPIGSFSIEAKKLSDLNRELKVNTAEPAELDIDKATSPGCVRFESEMGVRETTKADVNFPSTDKITEPTDSYPELMLNLAVLECIVATARQYSGTTKGREQAVTFRFPKDHMKHCEASIRDWGRPGLEFFFTLMLE